jgi:hypothetical protein
LSVAVKVQPAALNRPPKKSAADHEADIAFTFILKRLKAHTHTLL